MNKKFNENQKKAVEWGDGPILVLAGPGSGKTFVLTNRILNLIVNKNVSPNNILIVTFTSKAAYEMKERYKNLVNDSGCRFNDEPTFGTFHSIFFDILKESFGYTGSSLVSYDEEKKYLYRALEKERKITVTNDSVDNILKDIKNYKLLRERDEKYIPKYLQEKTFDRVYKNYEEILFNNRKLDFNGMISNCSYLLNKYSDIGKKYQNRYKYILIDEFQDINKEQYNIIKLLCKSKNLFVVGDDDQSIYRFRGSRPRVMNDFLSDYKKAKIIKLNENYRCAKSIVKFSKLVIDKNDDRFSKDLVSKRDDIGKIEIKAFLDSITENAYLIDKIKSYAKLGFKLSDMAILYRTNLISRSIISELKKHNIKYDCKNQNNSIYDSFVIKDILSYLKVSLNEKDAENMTNIINKPLRYISRDAIDINGSEIVDLIKYYKNKQYICDNLYKLENDLVKIRNLVPSLAIDYIRREMKYDDYLKKYCIEKSIDYDEVSMILDIFTEELIGIKSIKDVFEYIEKEKNNKNTKKDENVDSIKLMTFHLSKGLEFKVVFIIDANDGIIPHKKSINDNDIPTERRLFYVGMTRAKDFLHIFFTTNRFGKDFKPSRFIVEAIKDKEK